MNKKQKVLTVIALIAFIVIGAGHYLDWGLYRSEPITEWEEVTYEQAHLVISKAEFAKRLLDQGGYTDSKGQWHSTEFVASKDIDLDIYLLKNAGEIPSDAKLWELITSSSVFRTVWKPYVTMVHPNSAMVPDVRIPWFMLGVIYVGLFFLLADRREKR